MARQALATAPAEVPAPTDAGALRPVLELANISLSFGGLAALRDVDPDVAEGEIRAVIGPNGSASIRW
ncbi:MAG: hypothetical protein WA418_28560 [Bradyrhizobium sp.]